MAKRSDVILRLPPRYARNDPRNQARVPAGRLLSMQLEGYDYPIRKLRRVGENRCVTLPPQVRYSLDLKRGDWLMFGESPWSGSAWICKVTDAESQTLPPDETQEFRRMGRKVRGGKNGLFVNISPRVCEIISAELGDCLMFSLPSEAGVISVAAIKDGSDSAGCRRTG